MCLHFADHVGFESFGQFEQFADIGPINHALVVDVLLVLQQVFLILFEQCVEVAVFQDKAKLVGQEVVAHEGHQQHKVVDYLLHGAGLHFGEYFRVLCLEVLSEDVDHDEFEERRATFAEGGGGGPAETGLHGCVLLDDADVFQVER